ncbi:MAG: YibE/F family protein [Kiritimatiellia bacterium]
MGTKLLCACRCWGATCAVLAGCLVLFLLPGSKESPGQQGVKVCARVVEVDDGDLQQIGLLKMGSQHLVLEPLEGAAKGLRIRGENTLRAQMDLDKVFAPGDLCLAGILGNPGPGSVATAQDHYRLHWSLLLFALFLILLLFFAGGTGLKAFASFLFSCLAIWKLVIPLCLGGWSPIWVAVGTVCLLTAVIVFLVAGFTAKGWTAFGGSMLGVVSGAGMSGLFAYLLKVNGAVMPYAQPLLYSGYEWLDLREVFTGAMILASSGAVMDLGMDVAAGMAEVVRHRPSIGRRELVASGWRIGRSVVGTMTTTLLLAYSGGYLTLMMAFHAQGTGPVDFLNNPYVAAECVKTLVGSFTLVLVAPFTALAGGFLLLPRKVATCGTGSNQPAPLED